MVHLLSSTNRRWFWEVAMAPSSESLGSGLLQRAYSAGRTVRAMQRSRRLLDRAGRCADATAPDRDAGGGIPNWLSPTPSGTRRPRAQPLGLARCASLSLCVHACSLSGSRIAPWRHVLPRLTSYSSLAECAEINSQIDTLNQDADHYNARGELAAQTNVTISLGILRLIGWLSSDFSWSLDRTLMRSSTWVSLTPDGPPIPSSQLLPSPRAPPCHTCQAGSRGTFLVV